MDGWPRVAYRSLMRRLEPVVHLYWVHIRDLNSAGKDIQSTVEVRLATQTELYAFAEQNPSELSQAFVDSALARGDLCVATHNYASNRMNLRQGNRIVGYAGHATLFGRTICFRTPGAKRHSVRFYVARER